MEDRFIEENLKTRLILSGLRELSERGLADFSLRRVALDAQVSCAAPYRHFKGKDELILGIISYVRDGWLLLCEQISAVFSDSSLLRLCELCASGLRFWCGNGDFRSVLFLDNGDGMYRDELRLFDKPLLDTLGEFCREKGIDGEGEGELEYFILSLYRGTVMLVCADRLDTDTAVKRMKECISAKLESIQ